MNKTTLSIRSGLVILLAVSLAAFTECSRKGDREKLAGDVLLVNYLDHLLDKIRTSEGQVIVLMNILRKVE